MSKRFPFDLASRDTVKMTDKLLIHNIDTGVTEYTTVNELLNALAIYGDLNIGAGNLYNQWFGLLENHIDNLNGGVTIDYLNASNRTPGIILNYLGRVGFGIDPTGPFQINGGLAEHANNAAALLAGLTVGAFYRTGDDVKVVH